MTADLRPRQFYRLMKTARADAHFTNLFEVLLDPARHIR
jgi:hypothetical protein